MINLKCDSDIKNAHKMRRKRHIDLKKNCIRIANKRSDKKVGINNNVGNLLIYF